ncbi:MAG: sulfatase-like hydrolase/transferase [Phycisphaerae bacterium]|nr:sulfatase-like hydrolase/transferase [Phycisphaerae bacterium]
MARPNILLITTDQQRFDGLALNGNAILRTPNLDHLAARGVNFSRAYTTCPSCIAARRTILTGQLPATHGMVGYEDGVEFNPPFTLPGLLGRAGYQTQLIGKFHMYPQRKRFGFDNLVLSEQLEYRPDSRFFGQNDYADWLRRQGHSFNPQSTGLGANSWIARPWPHDEELHHTSWMAEEAIDFLTRRRDPSCPFFLHLSFWAPHPPLVPPQAYWNRYVNHPGLAPRIAEWAPKYESDCPGLAPDSFVGPFRAADIRDTIAGYYGMINHIDDRIAYVFSRLFEKGAARERDPLWIIFTSDHGEMLGDHHLYRKALPYEASAHVPFFIAAKNIDIAPQPSDAFASLEDILPTVCDIAGVDTPAGVDGRSLMPIVRGEASAVREQLHGEHSGGYANHFLLAGRHKYCWFAGSNEEQLFDLRSDPWELTDLSGRSTDVLADMRRRLAERLRGRTDYRYDIAELRPLNNQPPAALFDRKAKGYAG